MSAFAKATARQSSLSSTRRAKAGGKGIRTPDFQLAKLALYQLSYAPVPIADSRLRIADCKCVASASCHEVSKRLFGNRDACHVRHRVTRSFGKSRSRMASSVVAIRPFVRFLETGEAAFVRFESGLLCSLMSPGGFRQICCPHIICVDHSARYFSLVIYAFGTFEAGRKFGLFQVIEILHNTVVPNKRSAISVRVTGEPYHLSPFIDSVGFAVDISWEETEWPHSTLYLSK